MKLLKDERIDLEDGEVKLTMKPVTTSQQARMVEMGTLAGISERVAFTAWCLKNCIESISVSGESFDPAALADHADLSSTDTMAVFFKIGVMVSGAAFPSADTAKKSPQQPEPGA